MNLIKYIGKEYDRYNCLDLVKEFYLDIFGLTLKNYFEGDVPSDREKLQGLIVSNKGDFDKVGSPKFGDIVVIKLFGYSSHIGVCIGEGRFLHSVRTSGSCMDSLARYSKMIDGFYRHREHSK
jgi:cell wall-associated NlpC family hydrolase